MDINSSTKGVSTPNSTQRYAFTLQVAVCIAPRFGFFSSSKYAAKVAHDIEVLMRNILPALDLRGDRDGLTLEKRSSPSQDELFHEDIAVFGEVWGTTEQCEEAKRLLTSAATTIVNKYERVHTRHMRVIQPSPR